MNKSELLHWLQGEYQQWEAFLDHIGTERMEQPGVANHWSVKDIIAHLTVWHQDLVLRLQAIQRGEPDPPPPWPLHLEGEDEINEWIYETNRSRPVAEILDETEQGFKELFAIVEGFPEDVRIEVVHHDRDYYLVWLDDQRFPPGEFFDHFHDDHEPDIRAWLARAENNSEE